MVNLARQTSAVCALIVRHLDRPGVLATALRAVSEAKINVQEMENVVFEGSEAAVARIHLEAQPERTCWSTSGAIGTFSRRT